MDGAFRGPARAGSAPAEMKRIRSASRAAPDTVISALLAALRVMDGTGQSPLHNHPPRGPASGGPKGPCPTAPEPRPRNPGTRVRPSQKPRPAATHAAGCLPTRSAHPRIWPCPRHARDSPSSPDTLAADPSPSTHRNKTVLSAHHALHICPCDCLLPAHTHTRPGTLDPLALNLMFLAAHRPLRKMV